MRRWTLTFVLGALAALAAVCAPTLQPADGAHEMTGAAADAPDQTESDWLEGFWMETTYQTIACGMG